MSGGPEIAASGLLLADGTTVRRASTCPGHLAVVRNGHLARRDAEDRSGRSKQQQWASMTLGARGQRSGGADVGEPSESRRAPQAVPAISSMRPWTACTPSGPPSKMAPRRYTRICPDDRRASAALSSALPDSQATILRRRLCWARRAALRAPCLRRLALRPRASEFPYHEQPWLSFAYRATLQRSHQPTRLSLSAASSRKSKGSRRQQQLSRGQVTDVRPRSWRTRCGLARSRLALSSPSPGPPGHKRITVAVRTCWGAQGMRFARVMSPKCCRQDRRRSSGRSNSWTGRSCCRKA